MTKGFNKLKGLIIAGLVAAPMVATTVASHADSADFHEQYKRTVYNRIINDVRIPMHLKRIAVQELNNVHTDADLTQTYRETLAMALEQAKTVAPAPAASNTNFHEQYKRAVYDRIMSDTRISAQFKRIAVQEINNVYTDADLTQTYRETVAMSLEQAHLSSLTDVK